MQEFLAEKIQEGKGGHCSTEDSLASLKLTKLKLSKTLYFGDAVMGNVHNELRTYPQLGTYNYATSMLKQTTKLDKTASVVGLDDIGPKYKFYVDKGEEVKEISKIKCISEKSCKDVIRVMTESMDKFSLNIGHVKVQDDQLEGTKVLKNIDKWVKEVYDKSPVPGLIIILLLGSEKGNGGCFIQLKKDS